MTADQPTLGDCEPLWHDWDDLCQRGAEELCEPIDPRWHDLRRQGITAAQYHRIHDVELHGSYL